VKGVTGGRDVSSSYDAAAVEYARHLFDELEQKPLDRHLLDRFAEEVAGRGLVADLGCGPGHVAQYLHERGVEVIGVDLSPRMIEEAQRLCAGPRFQVGDMRSLQLPDEGVAGIVAFYSIVHFEIEEVQEAFREFRRVLRVGGLVLLAFHVGEQTVHVDDLWGSTVSLDFRFHVPAAVDERLRVERLVSLEVSEREPYEGVEYASRRCYMLARAV
jgi:SAM-dependent methyltransferase